MIDETVTISKKEYDELLDHQLKLFCLKDAGVDNWDGYELALQLYNESDENDF